jgi:MoaA/NifB/PqqE/SkfB family radical SAM enzyme
MNTFCVLPWYNQETRSNGSTTHCCWLTDPHDIQQIKHDLLTGIQSPACVECWNLEKNNKKSRRQQENEFLDFKLDRDISKLHQDCANNEHKILTYQLATSNICNQACVSCNSLSSTRWAEIEKKMGLTPRPFFQISDKQKNNIDYKSAKKISLLGGEPFFDSKTFEILEKLLDHNNLDCFVTLVTNGSIALDQQKINVLSNFTDLNICISIDGIGPVFEYMRWPGKWSMLTKNIKQYSTITSNLSVSYTISSLNALYYDETVQWFESNNLRYNLNIVNHPTWLSLSNTPVELKKILLEKKNFISNLLNINGSEISLTQYAEQIKNQDRAKKINCEDYLPEIANIINTQ